MAGDSLNHHQDKNTDMRRDIFRHYINFPKKYQIKVISAQIFYSFQGSRLREAKNSPQRRRFLNTDNFICQQSFSQYYSNVFEFGVSPFCPSVKKNINEAKQFGSLLITYILKSMFVLFNV